MRPLSAVLCAAVVALWPSVALGDDEVPLSRTEVSFTVTNVMEVGEQRTVHGYRIDPPCASPTAVLLQHGLSYTGEAWDMSDYSTARIIASAGYTVVAIDRLGYGRSRAEVDNGYLVSSEAYGLMAAQIVDELRTEFDHVALGGHSAGAEATQLAVGLFGADVEALMSLGYHQFPTEEILLDFLTGEVPSTLTDDYVYFLDTPERRAEMFYSDDADPEVIAADTEAAVLTPSGEIQSIGKQPSRAAAPQVTVPVFLQLAELDRLFDAGDADLAAALFATAPEVTVDIVEGTGHTFMLHHSGPAAAARMADWLTGLGGTPACDLQAAAGPSTPAPPTATPAPATPGPALPATGWGVTAGLVLLALSGVLASLDRRCRPRA